MNQAVTWDDVELAFRTEDEHRIAKESQRARKEQRMKTFTAAATRYINHGWGDYVIEDANDTDYTPKCDRKNGFSIDEAVKWMASHEAPFRITKAIHRKGSGIVFASKTRVVVEKPKTIVWFINYRPSDPRSDAKIAEMHKNLKAGMPQRLVALQYGFNCGTISEWCSKNGVKKTNMKEE